jgi:N-acetylmuramoyl-L-alanine amidase
MASIPRLAPWRTRLCRISRHAGAALIAALVLVPPPARAEGSVRDIRIAPHGELTRVVVDLDRPVAYRHIALDDPPRIAIDLPEVAWRVPESGSERFDGLVRGFRMGRFRPGISRLVLDLKRPFEVARIFDLPRNGGFGYRIVTDLVPGSSVTVGEIVGSERGTRPPSMIRRAAAGETIAAVQDSAVLTLPHLVPELKPHHLPALKPRLTDEPRIIVIDPGHGGIDPGAIGHHGTYEKNVVLAFGLELRRQLEATGRYKVVMTRERDRIVRLRDRLRAARDSRGELFLSLHADSLVQAPQVRGAAVYTLSENASNQEAARLAAKENRADILAGIDLSQQEDIVTEILIDLAQRDANNKSIRMADLLVGELNSVTTMLRRHRSQAGFVVLKSPDMPSVLLELGYLSNPEDERALRDPEHLAGLASAIVGAVDRYFGYDPSS